MSDKPFFRFHPDAYEHGVLEPSEETCSACGKPCTWKYNQHIYALPPDPKAICARCIADGNVAKAVPEGDYGLHDCEFDGETSDSLATEVEQRTPGFATFNPFVWPVRNGVPLAFLGFGADESLRGIRDVEAAIAKLAEEMNGEIAPDYAMIFKTLDGGEYVATLDID
ncbi:MAG: CbrC family protein [Parvularculaceae bacterium]